MSRIVIWLAGILSCVLAQEDNCTIDGEIFQRGENVGDAFVTRCGTSEEYPCFCNPDLENELECPYCGFSSGDGTLYCSKDGETITFPDGSVVRICTCEIPDDPTQNPIRECTVDDSGCSGCELPDKKDQLVCFEDGDSFGDLIEGACTPGTDWPSFCSVSSEGSGFGIGYPYCIFDDTASGEIVCATNNEEVMYDNKDGDEVTCTCIYSEDEGQQPSCKTRPDPLISPAPTLPPVQRPAAGEAVTNSPTTAPVSPTTAPASSAVLPTWSAGMVLLSALVFWVMA